MTETQAYLRSRSTRIDYKKLHQGDIVAQIGKFDTGLSTRPGVVISKYIGRNQFVKLSPVFSFVKNAEEYASKRHIEVTAIDISYSKSFQNCVGR